MTLLCRMDRAQLENLLAGGAEVYIMLQHPDCMPNDIERKSFADFVNLVKRLLPDVTRTSRLHVSLYKEQTTHRSLCFDDKLVTFSWYTYEYKKNDEGSNELKIYGRRQPHLVIDSSSQHFETFKAMFEREFITLQNSPLTMSLDDFLQQNPGYI